MSLQALSSLVLDQLPELSFSLLEIGARPVGSNEPFYLLMDCFPGSSLVGFEVDDELCEQMNRDAKSGYQYYSQAIGGANEKTLFHNTVHPMCSSLLEPETRIAEIYNAMDVMRPQNTIGVETMTLDRFTRDNNISDIDFIKIDVQGAELDIFQASVDTLKSVLTIVTEVEFIKLYKDQPLFGDVDRFLASQGFMFNKFIDLGGRALKPTILGNNPNTRSQLMWADAVFIRDIFEVESIDDEGLIKSAIIAYLYGSTDLTYFLLRHFDQRHESSRLSADFALIQNA